MRWLILLIFFVPLADGLALADYYDGLRAYDAKDYQTAIIEWEKAANLGDIQAQFRLGQLYKVGRGTPQNFIQAHLYFNLAAAQGHDDAMAARDSLAEQMTKSELAEARKLAAAWQPETSGTQPTSGKAPEAAAVPVPPQAIPAPVGPSPEQLWDAAAQGDTPTVGQLLAAGLDVNAADPDGWTALVMAAAEGRTETVQQLLTAGADIQIKTKDGATAFWVALLKGHQDIVALLIQQGASLKGTDPQGRPAVLVAVEQGHAPLVALLLESGADPNAASRSGALPVISAAASGHTAILEALLRHGSRVDAVDAQRATALSMALTNGQRDAVDLLLRAGAHLDLTSPEGAAVLAMLKDSGQTDLLVVLLKRAPGQLVEGVQLGRPEVVQAQLAQGADPNTKDSKGWPVLMLAAGNGASDMVALLLEAKADINATNAEGATALMAAVLGKHEAVVKQLIEGGGDAFAKNQAGATAIDMAKEKQLSNIMAILPKENTPMILVPAGEFAMGDASGEADEKPVHTVYLDAFYLDQYEVTIARYRKFISDTGRVTPSDLAISQETGYRLSAKEKNELFERKLQSGQLESFPARVGWSDAQVFCSWAGKRLPTEAEWEKAARGTDGRTYPWGDELDTEKYSPVPSRVDSSPRDVSPYGVNNMAGNIHEWVEDWYDDSYYKSSPKENPQGFQCSDCVLKVIRGLDPRLTNRYYFDVKTKKTGFRCVQEAK